MPGADELPSTLQRSPRKAQETWIAAHDSAVETYGEGERAHRVAYAALKHSFEKVGDHWEAKEHKGPSDPAAAASVPGGEDPGERETYGGVDANASKAHLLQLAGRLGIRGRSRMTKPELVEAIRRANARATARAREKERGAGADR